MPRRSCGTMNPSVARRDRLSRFVDLARVYRGWSRQELASNLGRDLSKVVPDSGNPKLDLVVALAEALDWSIGDVAQCVWDEPMGLPPGPVIALLCLALLPLAQVLRRAQAS